MNFYFKPPMTHISKIYPKVTTNFRVPFRFPSCNNCMYYENAQCKLFKYELVTDKHFVHYYVDAELCRQNKHLCGDEGNYFKSK